MVKQRKTWVSCLEKQLGCINFERLKEHWCT